MGFLAGKRALIVGVASKLSIASGIAAAMHREGAELAFTYQNEKLKGRVEDFAAGWGSSAELCFPCDVASDDELPPYSKPWARSGMAWTSSSTPLASPRATNWMATSPKSLPVKASALLTTSAPIASSPWLKPAAK